MSESAPSRERKDVPPTHATQALATVAGGTLLALVSGAAGGLAAPPGHGVLAAAAGTAYAAPMVVALAAFVVLVSTLMSKIVGGRQHARALLVVLLTGPLALAIFGLTWALTLFAFGWLGSFALAFVAAFTAERILAWGLRLDAENTFALAPALGLGIVAALAATQHFELIASMRPHAFDAKALMLFGINGAPLAVALALLPLIRPGVRTSAPMIGRAGATIALSLFALALAWLVHVRFLSYPLLGVKISLGFFEWVAWIGVLAWATPTTASTRAWTTRVCGAAALLWFGTGLLAATYDGQGVAPRRTSPMVELFALPWQAFDLDRDGYLPHGLGGRDCDNGRADVHPLAHEIPGDDIDQSCSGADLAASSGQAEIIAPAQRPADLTIVVTIDQLRPDFMSAYVEDGPDTTPNLRGMAGEFVRFDAAYAAGGITTLSLPSMLIGRYPMSIDFEPVYRTTKFTYVFPDELDDDVVTTHTFLSPRSDPHRSLPALFRGAGRKAYAAVDDGPAGIFQEGFGFDRDFDRFTFPNAPERVATWTHTSVTDEVLTLVEKAPEGSFLWVHYYDPHNATLPPCKHFDALPGVGCYADAIHTIDADLARVIGALRTSGRWKRSFFAITSDHGEAMGEHRYFHHGLESFEELVKVPMLVHLPEGKHGGEIVSAPVSTLDITATAAAYAGLEPPPSFQGEDLRQRVAGAPRQTPVLSQMLLMTVRGTPFRQNTLMVRGTERVMLDRVSGRRWMYDLAADPGQADGIEGEDLARATRELGLLLDALETRSVSPPTPPVPSPSAP